ncbi:MAG: cobyric acid synthase CobQ [Okeania sp. SIO3I5]|uniref:cobyric acid synthase CobQ n=1 Tax=Okeania sp. SIO3I5 TaxID=2607805 RepID=UPI0013B5B9CB|nr:cobyric acid synthase CobQ [Okeania sp. SIO3I5]NEQ40944.1 cobyric acid synthase CobQ [Okeania sp. SIO3I5]
MKAIMVVGTTSHAGKSLITTAICRILSRRGWRVAPFKGQNMALNSYVTSTGGEMGHAQAVQAWAAGVTPAIEMNPILLKPQGDMTSQVIIKGKALGTVGAVDYYQQYFNIGWDAIQESLGILSQEFDIIVCEGAGSPAEINLKHRDLTNMRVAKHLHASTILVVDIDRGGAFAHVIGTLELLEPEERDLIKGIVINKFRGQRSLLDSGIEWLEKRTNIPVVGVIPWINEAFPAEDSLSLLEQRSTKSTTDITIVIIRLPRISNFTDFEPLDAESSVKVKYVNPNDSFGYPDAIIIPGSKTTISDLLVLQKSGMAEAIKNYQASGGTVMGICGGFQMLGEVLVDSQGLEGKQGEYKGLELLPLRTVITPKKIARQRQLIANYPLGNLPVVGYEIHQGRTRVTKPDIVKPLFDDYDLGFVNSYQSVWGNYLHGIFDNGPWRRSWLNILRKKRGLDGLPTGIANYREQREMILDSITDQVNHHLDLKPIFQ